MSKKTTEMSKQKPKMRMRIDNEQRLSPLRSSHISDVQLCSVFTHVDLNKNVPAKPTTKLSATSKQRPPISGLM